jgi:hypothetical protein
MNREEQKQILDFIERAVKGRAGAALQPMDLEADAIIRARFVRNPEAAYRVTMLAMSLEAELEAMRERTEIIEAPSRPGLFTRIFSKRKLARALGKAQLPVLETSG